MTSDNRIRETLFTVAERCENPLPLRAGPFYIMKVTTFAKVRIPANYEV
jgi:hypothetical protein